MSDSQFLLILGFVLLVGQTNFQLIAVDDQVVVD